MPGPVEPARQMDDRAADRRGMPGCRYGNVDRPAAIVGHPVQLCRGLMAQRRPGPGTQDYGPEFSVAAGGAREGGVYPGLQALPPARAQLVVDGVRGYAAAHCLAARDDA